MGPIRLFVYPLTAAGGSRLFTDGLPPTRWSRTACEAYGNGVVHLQFALAPPGGSGEAAERPG